MQKIIPHLWFDHQAEEAANFYVSAFKNSRLGRITHYGETVAAVAGRAVGTVMTVTFELDGQEFYALNGGPHFTFSPAISLFVNCETQQEIDELWDKLLQGGEQEACGWLRDQYGVSWQIVPKQLAEMVDDNNPQKSESVMKAMLQMKKLDIARLQQAYDEA